MYRHSIDPLSGALGLITVAVGSAVAAGRADKIFENPVWWAAVVALPLGVAMIPWSHFIRRSEPAAEVVIGLPELEEHAAPHE